MVKGWWRGTPREKAFLKEAFAGACTEFYTVLGPGADRYHYNHFHVDLLVTNALHGRHFCQPRPRRGFFAQADDAADPISTASIKPFPFAGPRGRLGRKAGDCDTIATSHPRKTQYDRAVGESHQESATTA